MCQLPVNQVRLVHSKAKNSKSGDQEIFGLNSNILKLNRTAFEYGQIVSIIKMPLLFPGLC